MKDENIKIKEIKEQKTNIPNINNQEEQKNTNFSYDKREMYESSINPVKISTEDRTPLPPNNEDKNSK